MDFNGAKLAKVLLIVLVITGLFTVIHEYVVAVDTTNLPSWLATYWNYIITFFGLGTVTFLAAFTRNIYGYLRNYFATAHMEEYEMDKYLETLALYGGVITTFGTLIPAPYDAVGMLFVIIGEFLFSEYKKLKENI